MDRPTSRRRTRSRRARTGAALAGTLLAAACSGNGEGATPGTEPGIQARTGPDLARAATLQPFDACDSALRWFQDEALERVGPYGFGGGPMYYGSQGAARAEGDATAAAPAPPTSAPANASTTGAEAKRADGHSTTNNQEAGVDEPDIVKTDGRRIVSVSGQLVHVTGTDGGRPSALGSVALPVRGTHQLLLRGDNVLVLTTDQYASIGRLDGSARSSWAPYPYGAYGTSYLTRITLDAAGAPTVREQVRLDGTVVDARLIDGHARIVVSSSPNHLAFVHPGGPSPEAQAAAKAFNEDVIRKTTIDDWLPHLHTGDAAKQVEPGATPGTTPAPPRTADNRLVACEQLRHPQAFSGFDTLAVTTVDLGADGLRPTDGAGVVADGDTVYATPTSLYVATNERWFGVAPAPMPTPMPEVRPAQPPGSTPGSTPPGSTPGTAVTPSPDPAPAPQVPRTAVHRFAIDQPGPAQYRASGFVDGTFLSRYSFSEHEGHLRVVTTTGGWGCATCNGDQTHVSALAERDGELVVVGSVGGLGKGEAVKSVRFIGDLGYVVTFRQTDPLYVVDLSNPTAPKVTGELKVPGFSAYLHPVGDGLLLGVGQDATDQGRATGTKVALYDVRDPANPREVQHLVIPTGRSEVEQEPRAFLWWAPTGLAVIPIAHGTSQAAFLGALGVRVTPDGVREVGRISHEPATFGASMIRRSVVVGDSLFTVADVGIGSSSLGDLQPTGWLAFPVPAPGTPGAPPMVR